MTKWHKWPWDERGEEGGLRGGLRSFRRCYTSFFVDQNGALVFGFCGVLIKGGFYVR